MFHCTVAIADPFFENIIIYERHMKIYFDENFYRM